LAFPWSFESNLEGGVLTEWTGTRSDTDAKQNARHYVYLARFLSAYPDAAPYDGAYALHTNLAGGTNDSYELETTGFVVAASTAAAVRFYFYAASNLTCANNDTFDLLLWQSAGPVSEFSVNVLYTTAGGFVIRGGDTGGATFRSTSLILNQWHCVELVINTGSGANGTANFYVDGYQVGAQITGIASAALTQARFGAMNIDAGTTAGHLLFDAVVVDNARVGTLAMRFSRRRYATKSKHIAIGQGIFCDPVLYAGSEDNTLTLYDTDRADTSDTSTILFGPLQGTGVQTVVPEVHRIYYRNGVYAALTGTNPRAQVTIEEGADMSLGQIRTLGAGRL